jgi:hypothetical protein
VQPISKYKEVENDVCGKSNCKKKSQVKISFKAGFSAWFCVECGTDIVRDGLGVTQDEEIDIIQQT